MLAQLINQMRARRLRKIGDASAKQSELRSLQFGKIKRKRNLPLEPRLHRVPVGGLASVATCRSASSLYTRCRRALSRLTYRFTASDRITNDNAGKTRIFH